MTEAGAVSWAEGLDGIDPNIISVWDYVLIWINSSNGSDRFGAISRLATLSQEVKTAITLIGVHGTHVNAVVQLRLAEAGFRYLVPHSWLSGNLAHLPDLLSSASIPIRFHLSTPLALRESLGLNLSGELAKLVDAASSLPEAVWLCRKLSPNEELTRATINQVRAIALHSAGVRAPDFTKYATSVRRPPELPEWPRVRELLRQGLGYAYTAP